MRVLPHERRSDPLERLDATLFATLGLVSVIARFDALLQSHGRPRRVSSARPGSPTNIEDERLLMALVGLIALRATCGAHLQALIADGRATRSSSAPAETIPTASRPTGSLLR